MPLGRIKDLLRCGEARCEVRDFLEASFLRAVVPFSACVARNPIARECVGRVSVSSFVGNNVVIRSWGVGLAQGTATGSGLNVRVA